ncbi:hypothetical protein Tco_0156861 [Tanacetum coccineum]
MLAICTADKPMVFKAPKTSSKAKSVSQGTNPGAQTGHKKPLTSSKQTSVSSKEATKGGSFKAPTGSKTSHSKKRKESSSAMDSNPSEPLVSTLVDTGIHKEDQQATGGPTSLGVTSEERANSQLNSGMSTYNLNEAIYLASFIIHSESPLGNDASAASTAKADPGNFAPSTDPHEKEPAPLLDKLRKKKPPTIKLEDLAKLVSNVEPIFKDPNSPEDDPVIVVDDSDEDEEDEVHPTLNAETEDTSVHKSSSPSELLVKSLKSEFSKFLSTHDFSSSLPTKLKDLPSKFNDLTKEWELPAEFLAMPSQVEMVQAKLKTLDALPSLLNKVTNALNQFLYAITSKKIKGDSGEHIKEEKGKKDLSSEEAEKESTDSNSDDETHVTGSIVEPSRTKKLKKFDFITEDGRHIHLTKEKINHRKKLEEDAKAKAAKQ